MQGRVCSLGVNVPADASPDSGTALVGSASPAGMPKKASPGGRASCCSSATGRAPAAALCCTCAAGSVPEMFWPTSAGPFLLSASASATNAASYDH